MSELDQTLPPLQTDKPAAPAEPAAPPAKKGIRWTHVAIWALAIGFLGLLGWGLVNVNAPRPEAGQAAPDFEMAFFDGYDWEGRSVANLTDLEGKVVVLNFWASWCVECRLEADLLEQASRQYGDEVVFLGVAYVDAEPNSLEYLAEYGITYPNAPDLRSAISDKYEITGVPETFFIGKDGTIAQVVIGPVNEATLHGQIGNLLSQ
jgi:cytochrome c biogenesis protein CcmG/thiol:disulfide interchange protein DsbE